MFISWFCHKALGFFVDSFISCFFKAPFKVLWSWSPECPLLTTFCLTGHPPRLCSWSLRLCLQSWLELQTSRAEPRKPDTAGLIACSREHGAGDQRRTSQLVSSADPLYQGLLLTAAPCARENPAAGLFLKQCFYLSSLPHQSVSVAFCLKYSFSTGSPSVYSAIY